MESGGGKFFTNRDILEDGRKRLETSELMAFCYAVAVWELHQKMNHEDKNEERAKEHEYNFLWWQEAARKLLSDKVNELLK